MADPAARLRPREERQRRVSPAALRDVRPDLEQGVDERAALGIGQSRERLLALALTECPHALEHGRNLRRGVEPAGAAVARVGASLDPACGLEPIDQTAERHALDLEDIGEPALIDALMAMEMRQHLPLRAAQPQRDGALVEALAQESRDVVQEEAEAMLRTRVHDTNMLSRLLISKLMFMTGKSLKIKQPACQSNQPKRAAAVRGGASGPG